MGKKIILVFILGIIGSFIGKMIARFMLNIKKRKKLINNNNNNI
jgi:hypothetical protein